MRACLYNDGKKERMGYSPGKVEGIASRTISMPKAVITKIKDQRGDAVVRVDGVRIGTATHNPATKDYPASWTFWVDEKYRDQLSFVRASSATEVREQAVAAFINKSQPAPRVEEQ